MTWKSRRIMLTGTDERQGLVKTDWASVRKRVAEVEPIFAKIVDELNPDKSYPLYLAYYPYGAIDADTQSSLFPDLDGGYYRITDSNAPKDVVTHLGYSKDNTPLGMVLDKQIECFIDLQDEAITIPWLIYTPGKIFPLTRILHKENGRIYSPNGLHSSTAGSRSAFMLPNIGCAVNHSNLQRDFNFHCPAPKTLYEQWDIFKKIINSKEINSDWRCCVMYFSSKWLDRINKDKSWRDLQQYLHRIAWHEREYEVNRIHYDIIFSLIQKNRNLKPNPYLTDTAKHLFATALGVAPGYEPATNNEGLPLNLLQNVFIESYGMKKYIPTIMQAAHFNFEGQGSPIYYSLQNPSTHVFSPKSRVDSSILFEMRELEHIMKIFINELSKSSSMCADTILGEISRKINFSFFHNKSDRHKIVRSSSEIDRLDARFTHYPNKYKKNGAAFASDAPFLRGCIRIAVT